jgi:hypothetical protein
VYILNRDAGGQLGHISLHKDGRCHAKFATGPKAVEKVHDWTLPDPLPGTNIRRLADVVIPHLGLVLPVAHVAADPDTVLISPPEAGQQLRVILFLEPGPVDYTAWPGKAAMGSGYVGRAVIYSDELGDLLNFTAVTTYEPESEFAEQISKARLSAPPGVALPEAPRVVVLLRIDADGAEVPGLMEMPLGHLADPEQDATDSAER